MYFPKAPAERADLMNSAEYDRKEYSFDHEEEEQLNVEVSEASAGVVVLTRISPYSALSKNVLVGDFVLSVNGKEIHSRQEFFRFVSKAAPKLQLVIARAKSPATGQPPKRTKGKGQSEGSAPPSPSTLTSTSIGQAQKTASNRTVGRSDLTNSALYERLKISFEHDEEESLNVEVADVVPGVVVFTRISPYSILTKYVFVGDYALSVNKKEVRSREDFFRLVSKATPRSKLLIARARTGNQLTKVPIQQSSPPKPAGQQPLSPKAAIQQSVPQKPISLASISAKQVGQQTSPIVKDISPIPSPSTLTSATVAPDKRATQSKPSLPTKESRLQRNDLLNESMFDQLEITLEHEEEEQLNVELADVVPGVVVVTKVLSLSSLAGAVLAGDYVLKVNEKEVKTRQDFFYMVSKSAPKLNILIARPVQNVKSPPEFQGIWSTIQSMLTGTVPAKQTSGQPKAVKLSNADQSSSSSSQASEASSLSKSSSVSGKVERHEHEHKERVIVIVKGSKLKKHFGLSIISQPNDKSVVVINSIQPYSISSDYFKVGDRILEINSTKVTDVKMCKQLIIDSKLDFTALVERRQAEEKAEQVDEKQVISSYTPPSSRPSDKLGDPLLGYSTGPDDVQAIINKRMPEIMASFAPKKDEEKVRSKSNRDKSGKDKSEKVVIEDDVTEHNIESEVHPNTRLRKPPKRS